MSATASKRDCFKRRPLASYLRWLVIGIAALAASEAAVASEPKISVASLVKAEVSSQTDFHIQIDWPAPPPSNSLLLVIGLPKSVTFSAGSATGSLWELPLTELDKLKIIVPSVEPMRGNLSFYLVKKQQSGIVILASTHSMLAIEASARPRTAATKPGDAKTIEKSPQATSVESKLVAGGDERASKDPAGEARVDQANKALEEARAKVAAKRAEAEHLTAEAAKIEQARKTEEARIEEARRQIAAKRAEAENLAAEVARVEQAKKAEEARIEEARRQVAAQKAEADRLAVEVARVEETRKADEARIDEARRQAAAKQAEAERMTAEAARMEQVRKAERAKVEEDLRQAATKHAETLRLATEIEAARKVQEARIEEAQRQALARQAEAGRLAAVLAERGKKELAAAEKAATPHPKAEDSLAAANRADDRLNPALAPVQSDRLVKRGDEYLSQGNVTIAREYFLRAARSGVAIAALKLAETYDPHELARMNVHGLAPNIAEARRWYRRALELGANDATVRLSRLGD